MLSAAERPLDRDTWFQLECVRGGGCCYAQRIPVTPWEIAMLARALALPAHAVRDQHTFAGGTRLRSRADGGCSLLSEDGCTVHPGRPLACRLFPLGRKLFDGGSVYHTAATHHRCEKLCPTALDQPPRQVGAWLAEQGVGPGEIAHDLYGRLVAGLLTQAVALAGPEFMAVAKERAQWDADQRAAALSRSWYALTTAPELGDCVDDPSAFVQGHADAILNAVANGFAGEPPAAALVLLTIGLHLADPLGMPTAAVLTFLATQMPASDAPTETATPPPTDPAP